jgi:hypothetical protein
MANPPLPRGTVFLPVPKLFFVSSIQVQLDLTHTHTHITYTSHTPKVHKIDLNIHTKPRR